jgi:Gpi18-like mannosyltransferase
MKTIGALIKNNIFNYSFLAFLFLIGVFVRIIGLQTLNVDTDNYLIPWYDYIIKHGILGALGDNFANYTPPYTYFLALMTATPLPKIIAIKLIPIFMDIIDSLIIYKIVRYKYSKGFLAWWAAILFWCLPTVIMNSAYWGQADSFYTGFLLMTLYYLIKNRPLIAVLFFSVAITFKLQAIFMAPVLVILMFTPIVNSNKLVFQKRVKIWYFILIPFVYSLLCLPVVILGRSWSDVWSIYLVQAGTFKNLNDYAPNLYVFISNNYFDTISKLGLMVAAFIMLIWILYTIKVEIKFTIEKLMFTALTSVALAPFLLPKMHERYFYPADVISLIVAFYIPRLWFLPLGFQLISCLSYYPVLSNTWAHTTVKYAAIINTLLIAFIVWKQISSKKE